LNMKENCEAIRTLRDGEPCSHKGCLSHISHPCEGCGRIGGKGVVLMSNPEKSNDRLLEAFRKRDKNSTLYFVIPTAEEKE